MAEYDVKFTNNYDPINNPTGLHPIQIQESSIDTSTDIALFGRKRLQYGQDMNQNLLSLLEKFACPENASNPGNPDPIRSAGKLEHPIVGQIWYNSTQKVPFVWDGTQWVSLLSQGSIASNWGIITNGQQIPQPQSDDGYTFGYNECVWIVGIYSIDQELTNYVIETSTTGLVTATDVNIGDLVVSYLIIGIKGNVNSGTINPVITPTPTPTISFTPTATPAPVDLANKLVSYWEFEEPSSSVFYMDCAGGNNFTRTGDSALNVPGVVADAMQAGSTTFLESNPTLGMIAGPNAAYTFGGWFRANDDLTAYSNLFQRGIFGTPGQRSFTLSYTRGTDNLFFYKSHDGTAYEFISTPSGVGLNSGYHFIVCWVDTTTKTMNIQVDNREIYSSQYLFDATYNIGTLKLGSSTSIPLRATTDQLFYYGRMLNSAERSALYNNGHGATCSDVTGIVTPTPTPTRTPTPSPTPSKAIIPLSVAINGSYSVSGECTRSGVGTCSALTDTAGVVASGGSGSYSYQWVLVSGFGNQSSPVIATVINSPTSPSTTFTRTADASYYVGTAPAALVGNYRCIVTDTIFGGSAQSPVITVSTRHMYTPVPVVVNIGGNTHAFCQSGWPDSSHSCQASVTLTALVTGGTGTYTYLWSYVSGEVFNITSPTAVTTFIRQLKVAHNQTITGVYRLTTNDGITSTSKDFTVSLEFANEQ